MSEITLSTLDMLKQELQEHDKNRPPLVKAPELFCEETSKGGLADFVAYGHPSIMLKSDEGSLVVGSHGMGDKEMMGFLGLINRFWDGRPYDPHFKTANPTLCDGYRFSVNLMIQGVIWDQWQVKQDGLTRGMGTFSRYLISKPVSTMGTREYQEPPIGTPKIQAFYDQITSIMDISLSLDADGRIEAYTLNLSIEAKNTWEEFFNVIENNLKIGGDFSEVKDVASKIAEQAARIAGVLHVFGKGPTGSIDENTMKNAIALAAWYLHEARRIFIASTVPSELKDAANLFDWIKGYCLENNTDQLLISEILKFAQPKFRNQKKRNEALAQLVESGHVKHKNKGKQKFIEIRPEFLED